MHSVDSTESGKLLKHEFGSVQRSSLLPVSVVSPLSLMQEVVGSRFTLFTIFFYKSCRFCPFYKIYLGKTRRYLSITFFIMIFCRILQSLNKQFVKKWYWNTLPLALELEVLAHCHQDIGKSSHTCFSVLSHSIEFYRIPELT